jgi:hypothetical protein
MFDKHAGRDVDNFIKRMAQSYGASVAIMVMNRDDDKLMIHKSVHSMLLMPVHLMISFQHGFPRQATRPSQGQSPFWE